MDEVRWPSDGELCGSVEQRGEHWYALTVFGAVLVDMIVARMRRITC